MAVLDVPSHVLHVGTYYMPQYSMTYILHLYVNVVYVIQCSKIWDKTTLHILEKHVIIIFSIFSFGYFLLLLLVCCYESQY